MPYIRTQDREAFHQLDDLPGADDAGELNYQFTKIALNYLEVHGNRYQVFNDIIGALEGAKLELYRRRVAPYEDTKIAENGDVY